MYITLSSRAFLSAASTETCLPRSQEGMEGGGGWGGECCVEGNKIKKKIQNDTERTEQWRQQKGKAEKQGRTHIQSNHKKLNIEIKVIKSLIKRLEYAEIPRDDKNWMKWTEGKRWDSRLWQSLCPLLYDAYHFLNVSFFSYYQSGESISGSMQLPGEKQKNPASALFYVRAIHYILHNDRPRGRAFKMMARHLLHLVVTGRRVEVSSPALHCYQIIYAWSGQMQTFLISF